MNNLYGTGKSSRLKKLHKRLTTKINENREKIPIYLFFIKFKDFILICILSQNRPKRRLRDSIQVSRKNLRISPV